MEFSWECHCAVWFEGTELVEGECQNNTEVVAQGFSFGAQPSLGDYADHVEQYNCRALTYPEDALDAFGGILTTLSTIFLGGFICGLPSMFFDASLLWCNKSPLERRHARRQDTGITMPPTWAWAAWGGAITFRDNSRDPNSIRPLVQWKYRANHQTPWQSILPFEPQSSSGIQKEIDRSGASETANTTSWTAHDDEGYLRIPSFWEESSYYLLFSRPMRAFFRIMEVYRDIQVLLVGELGPCVGMLTSCEALGYRTNAKDLLCEVVAISELSENGNGVFNVIWIEWKDGIAYRKGVGWVSKLAWAAQKSERIDLILG